MNTARNYLKVHGQFIARGRAKGEAPGVLILPMKQPVLDVKKHLPQRTGIALTT